MFREREEELKDKTEDEVVEEVKVKKPRKKATSNKTKTTRKKSVTETKKKVITKRKTIDSNSDEPRSKLSVKKKSTLKRP